MGWRFLGTVIVKMKDKGFQFKAHLRVKSSEVIAFVKENVKFGSVNVILSPASRVLAVSSLTTIEEFWPPMGEENSSEEETKPTTGGSVNLSAPVSRKRFCQVIVNAPED